MACISFVVFMVLVHKVSGVGCLSVGTKNHINCCCLPSFGKTSEEGMDLPHLSLLQEVYDTFDLVSFSRVCLSKSKIT